MTVSEMSKQKRENQIRTSVQLPAGRLEELAKSFPDLAQSEAIRIALDRHTYMMTDARFGVRALLEDGDVQNLVERALRDYTSTDWRTIALALPQLVEAAMIETGITDGELRQRIIAMDVNQRLAVLDWAIAQRSEP